jgi:hypothetical protein
MKKILVTVASLILSLGLLQPSCANPNPFQITDALDKRIQDGLSHLYNLEFNEADKIFRELHDQAAEHPMVAFGKASVHWWRLSVFVLETDPIESKAFIEAVNECIQLSKKKIARGDPTGEGYLTLGGACGLLGRWQATNQEWISAYFTGKKAIKYLRKALKVNPEMKDANMGLGIFDYYVATLPAVVRVLAFLGSGGDSRVGLQELETAAHQGTYATTPSKLFLVDLYSNQENKPEKAFELLGSLRKEYPVSPFIHMLHIITAYNNNRIELLEEQVKSYEQFVASGTYRPEFTTNSHFVTRMLHFKSREPPQNFF